MSNVWVPPRVSRELQEETLERETIALNNRLTDNWPWLREFNRRLDDEIGRGVELFLCPDPAPLELVALGARPGRWGVLVPGRLGGPASVIPIMDHDGGFQEPGEFIFDWLRANDWQNTAVMRDRAKRDADAKAAQKKRDQEEKERADREVLEMYLAKTRTQVSMNPDTPWAQNAAGYRRVRGGKK